MVDKNLLTSFYFSLSISKEGNPSDAAFQEASGLSKEMGLEDVVSGGENRFKYRLPTNVTYPNLVLKRGIVMEYSPLIEWCQTTLDGGMGKPIKTKNIMLSLLDKTGQTCMSWHFVGAYPIKWAMSDLKSQENTMLIETIELAYQYFKVIDIRNKNKVKKNNENEYAGISAMFGGS